jgi:galactose mutarotase-like enzyme
MTEGARQEVATLVRATLEGATLEGATLVRVASDQTIIKKVDLKKILKETTETGAIKMIIIESDVLKIAINQKGAELTQIASKTTKKEYLWDANPDVWASHAPVLFPTIGALKDNTYFYQGKAYQLPKHGFVRNNTSIELRSQSTNSVTLGLTSSEATRAVYPFDFNFLITYSVTENKLTVDHEVINTGNSDLLFSLGAHPGFMCPINAGEAYDDYFLEFEQKETAATWELTSGGTIGNTTIPVLDNSAILPLHAHIFDRDALIFKDLKSRKVTLKNKLSSQTVTVEYPDFNYLGIWAKPGASFVCIEPWLGIADSADTNQELVTKEGILNLAAGKTFTASYSVTISE